MSTIKQTQYFARDYDIQNNIIAAPEGKGRGSAGNAVADD
jgi:hypothetical protein